MRSPFSVLLLVMAISAAAADSNDYAFRSQLEDSEANLQRIVLPAEVIQNLARRDMRDIAVFNANGKLMPLQVKPSPGRAIEHELELPFHEFERFLRQRSKTVTTRAQNQDNGGLTELATTETIDVQTVHKTYLVELEPDDQRRKYDRIELDWQHEPSTQLLQIKVESGNELDRLQTLHSRRSLTKRDPGDVSWRSIDGLRSGHKYLRLSPANDVELFRLSRVTGHYRDLQQPPRLSVKIVPDTIEENGTVFYTFEIPSAAAPAAMAIVPADANSVFRGDLFVQRENHEQKTLVKRQFQQHNLSGAAVVPSEALKLPKYSFTRVWFTSSQAIETAPAVELFYPQFEAVFLSDGNSPYTLAWGNHQVGVHPPELRALIDPEKQADEFEATTVSLLAIEEAGGLARLVPEPEFPWKKWLLWALLVVAAVVTGRMAIKLYREMSAEPP